MAITKIQNNFFVGTSPVGTSQNVTFLSTPSGGNMITVGISYFGHHASGTQRLQSVTDNKGNTYNPAIAEVSANNNGVSDFVDIYFAKNITSSGTFTVTANFTGSESPNMDIAEWAGVDTTAPEIGSSSGFGNGTLVNPGALTPGQANSLIYSFGADDNGNNTTVNFLNNFTGMGSSLDSNTHERGYDEFLVQGAGSAGTASFGIALASNWGALVGVFKPAAAATTPTIGYKSLLGVGI